MNLKARLEKLDAMSLGRWNVPVFLANLKARECGLPEPYPNLPPAPEDVLRWLASLPVPP